MVLVLALAGGEETGDAGLLLVVDPEAAHRVVHAGEDLHRHARRVVADELLVDLDDALQLLLELLAAEVREIEIDLIFPIDAELELAADVEDLARRDVARHQVPVRRVALLEEVPG